MAATTRRARATGRLVTVVSAADEGLDPGENGETRWYAICDDHGFCSGHATRKVAERFAATPAVWCEVCGGSYDPSDESR